MLDCVAVTEKDPACDVTGTKNEDFVAKCNVAEDDDVDDGECRSFPKPPRVAVNPYRKHPAFSPGAKANKKLDSNPAYAQLVRQLAPAKLNLAATGVNFGDCGPEIAARIAQCEGLCGASKGQINNSGCITDLTAFNESLDTFEMPPAPFDAPGPGVPGQCQAATGNGIIIGKQCQ